MAITPTTSVRVAMEANGMTIITMPAMVPMMPKATCQPRAGMVSSEAAATVSKVPRSSQLKPIHRASRKSDSRGPRKADQSQRMEAAPVTKCSTRRCRGTWVPKAAASWKTPVASR